MDVRSRDFTIAQSELRAFAVAPRDAQYVLGKAVDAYLAAVLGILGDVEGARQVWSELMAINPDYLFASPPHRMTTWSTNPFTIPPGSHGFGTE
jgi:hypothetical protein